MAFPSECEQAERECVRVSALVSLLTKTLSLLDQAPHWWLHLTLITALRTLSPNTVTLGVDASTYEWVGRGGTIKSIIASFYQIYSFEMNQIPLFQVLFLVCPSISSSSFSSFIASWYYSHLPSFSPVGEIQSKKCIKSFHNGLGFPNLNAHTHTHIIHIHKLTHIYIHNEFGTQNGAHSF